MEQVRTGYHPEQAPSIQTPKRRNSALKESPWHQWMAALEQELAAFFDPLDLELGLRRAGRRFGDRLAGHRLEENPTLAAKPMAEQAEIILRQLIGLPLRRQEDVFWLDPGEGQKGLAAWCAGLLEGLHAKHLAVRTTVLGDGSVRLHWAVSGARAEYRTGFQISASGPLAPYQLAQLADLSTDAILFVDGQRTIRAWNKGAEQMFGYRASDAIGSYYDLLVPPNLVQSGELGRIAEETERTGTLRNYVTKRLTKDGRELTVSLTRTKVVGIDGQVAGYGVILRDITEAERLKTALDTARHLSHIGELASQVAHEVRNPLAGIHGALQILRRRLDPDPNEVEVFDNIGREIARLDRLVTDLMRFGRPASSHQKEVDLADWLQEWHRRMALELEQRGAEVHLDLQANPKVQLDFQLFEQVLRNLLENSLEASEVPAQIRLQLEQAPDGARLLFRDQGPGFSEEIRAEVLQPFFTTKTRGSGLGLPICVRHLGTLGGGLRLLPNDGGAVVELRLPYSVGAS